MNNFSSQKLVNFKPYFSRPRKNCGNNNANMAIRAVGLNDLHIRFWNWRSTVYNNPCSCQLEHCVVNFSSPLQPHYTFLNKLRSQNVTMPNEPCRLATKNTARFNCYLDISYCFAKFEIPLTIYR